jgi:hypothetical protein
MKYRVIIAILGFLCFSSLYSQDTLWTKKYGHTGNSFAVGLMEISHGNYIAAGMTNISGINNYDAWVLKLDNQGDTLWSRTYGGLTNDMVKTIIQVSDSNYLVAGLSYSFAEDESDAWLLMLKDNGDTAWSKSFGGAGFDGANSAVKCTDGNIIVAGYTESQGTGARDMWLIKIDPNGNQVWSRTYGGTQWDEAKCIIKTNDGHYLVAGLTNSFGAGNSDIWLMKIKGDLDTVWTRTYGGAGWEGEYTWDEIINLMQDRDGNFLLAGRTQSFGAGSYDAWILKFDNYGDTLWSRTYGGTSKDAANSIVQCRDGYYLVGGLTRSFSTDSTDGWMVKLKADGDTLWSMVYGDTNSDGVNSIIQCSNGDYLIGGWAKSFNQNKYDLYLARIAMEQIHYYNTAFYYKILPPLDSTGTPWDSSIFTYISVEAPMGMDVTPGGTIIWTPFGDSIYAVPVQFQVIGDIGDSDTIIFYKDTVSFHILVNLDSTQVDTNTVFDVGIDNFEIFSDRPLQMTVWPNPFSTSVEIKLVTNSELRFTNSNVGIYDISGKKVYSKIVNRHSSLVWDGRNNQGKGAAPGTYFIRLKTEESTLVKAVTLSR